VVSSEEYELFMYVEGNIINTKLNKWHNEYLYSVTARHGYKRK
jgi:hypothetical protein